ncbi:MAG: hypothetical protein PF503_01695, partial [Desulfobacula sp.]|nr:hypothetical protein [Desulfobacula sp.]
MEGKLCHLLFLAENHLYRQMVTVLKACRPGLWGNMSRDEFGRCFTGIKQALKDESALIRFVELGIVTEARCFPATIPSWAVFWIRNNILSDFSEKQVWQHMFLPLVDSHNNHADFCMLVGTLSSEKNAEVMPEWALPLVDRASNSAVRTAETAARSLAHHVTGSLVVYPLLSPNGRVQITRPVQLESKIFSTAYAASLNSSSLSSNHFLLSLFLSTAVI